LAVDQSTGPGEPSRSGPQPGRLVGSASDAGAGPGEAERTADPGGRGSEPGAARCLECGSAVADRYCGRCGQEAVPAVGTVRDLLSSTVDNYFALDSKLVRSLIPFFRHPGMLSEEYVHGRRQRYVSPIRLYLASSVLFFLVAAFFVDRSDSGFLRITDTSRSAPTDSAAAGPAAEVTQPAGEDSLPPSEGMESSASEGLLGRFLQKLLQTDPQVISAHFLRQLPRALFVLVPVFALLLKLFYVRRSRLYLEHLVLALHSHALLFLVATPALLSRSAIVGQIAILGAGVHTLFAMKRFYRQGWGRTIAKFLLLVACYSGLVGAAMIVTLVVTVLFSL
jgi:hypothetical protein